MPEHYVETDGGRVYVEVEGETGELVLLATGGPGASHDHYHPWFSRLLPEFRVGYVDYIGCGLSDRLADPRGYSVELFARNLQAICDHLETELVSVIGISFGGFPAVEFALAHPGRVRRLGRPGRSPAALVRARGRLRSAPVLARR
jgi:proline iminopeptidase